METTGIGRLRRSARLDVAQLDLALRSPRQEMRARELRAIVAANRLRPPALGDDLIQHPCHASAAKALVHQRQTIAREDIGHISTRIIIPAAITSCAKWSSHCWLEPVSAGSGDPMRAQCLRFFRFSHKPPRDRAAKAACGSLDRPPAARTAASNSRSASPRSPHRLPSQANSLDHDE